MSKIKKEDQEEDKGSASTPPQPAPSNANEQVQIFFGIDLAPETEPERVRRQAQNVMHYEIELKARQSWVDSSSGEGVLRLSRRRLQAIQARLREDFTVADCVRVLNELAQECLRKPECRKWWNGTTEWRGPNFERVLSSPWSATVTDRITDRGEIVPKQVDSDDLPRDPEHPVALAHKNPNGPGYIHRLTEGRPVSIETLRGMLRLEKKGM